MTFDQAEKISAYILDSGLDGRVLTVGRGDEYCVRIVGVHCWHCWSFADWNAFAKEHKKKRRKAARNEAIVKALRTGEPTVIRP